MQKGKIAQLTATVKYITETLSKEKDKNDSLFKVKTRPIWCEPLEEVIFYDELIANNKFDVAKLELNNKKNINMLIGLFDATNKQRQEPYLLNLTDCGNILIYGATDKGKTSFLSICLYSLIKNFSSEDMNFYIIDFGTGGLLKYANAPHVGDVVSIDEMHKIPYLIEMLKNEIKRRSKIFKEHGYNNYSEYLDSENTDALPRIVLVLNGWDEFRTSCEAYILPLIGLARKSISYGINIIISSLSTNTTSYVLRACFSKQIVLQMNQPLDYFEIVGRVDNGRVPKNCKGRGFFSETYGKNKVVYEFQTAFLTPKESERNEFIRNFCDKLKQTNFHYAPLIPLPLDDVKFSDIKDDINSLDSIPIGIYNDIMEKEQKTATFSLDGRYIYKIISSETMNNTPILDTLTKNLSKILEILSKKSNILVYVVDAENFYEIFENLHNKLTNMTKNSKEEVIIFIPKYDALRSELKRKNADFFNSELDCYNWLKITLNQIHKGLDSEKYKDLFHFVIADDYESYSNYGMIETVKKSDYGYSENTGWGKKTTSDVYGIFIGENVGDAMNSEIITINTESIPAELSKNNAIIIENKNYVVATIVTRME